MKDLLICIPFHQAFDIKRTRILLDNIGAYTFKYGCSVDIIIDTNESPFVGITKNSIVEIFEHKTLAHPFHLTSFHRQHFKDNIENYKNFMYIEDDMLLPYQNYLSYLEKFRFLWPGFVPSFVRIEKKDTIEYISDIPERHNLTKNIIEINGRIFTSFKFPHNYHAFWIMPQKELRESMTEDFTTLSDFREKNASYPSWQLHKPPLVELEKIDGKYFIKKDCYSYHLPNNYALSPDSPNAKLTPEEIFI